MKAFAIALSLLAASWAIVGNAEAQVPTTTPLVQVSLSATPSGGMVERFVPSSVALTVRDLSRDPTTSVYIHVTTLTARILETEHTGWTTTVGPNVLYTQSGEEAIATLSLIAGAPTKVAYVHVAVSAVMQAIDPAKGNAVSEFTSEDTLAFQLVPYYQSVVQIRSQPQRAGPFEAVLYPVTVTNAGPYPDTYTLKARAESGSFVVSVQSDLVLLPGETIDVPLAIVTPKDKLFFNGDSTAVLVELRSANDPGVAYVASTVVTVDGMYVPGYWWPLLALGAVLSGTTIHRAAERLRRRGLEEGRPPRRLSEEELLELEVLKLTDRDAYELRREQLASRRRARYEVWREQHHKRRAIERAVRARQREETARILAEERSLARARQKIEYEKRLAESAAAKINREREKQEEKTRRAAERTQAKIDRKDEKRRQKQAAKLEKQRAKLESKLTKERARAFASAEKERKRTLHALEKKKKAVEKERGKG